MPRTSITQFPSTLRDAPDVVLQLGPPTAVIEQELEEMASSPATPYAAGVVPLRIEPVPVSGKTDHKADPEPQRLRRGLGG